MLTEKQIIEMMSLIQKGSIEDLNSFRDRIVVEIQFRLDKNARSIAEILNKK